MVTIARETTIVEVPEGFHLGSMSVHADSWEAYDALTEEAGWTEVSYQGHTWKKLEGCDGANIAAHEPHWPREVTS